MLIRTLLIMAALAAPAPAQTGGRYKPLPKPLAPPKPVVIATPAPATPAPKSKKTVRTAKPKRPAATVEQPLQTPEPEATSLEKLAPAPVTKRAPAAVVPPSNATYGTKIKAVFARRWADAVQPHMSDFQPGNVSVLFKLDASGKVTSFSVVENTSNEAFAKFCEQFVQETTFDPPPAKALTDGQLEVPFNFWIY